MSAREGGGREGGGIKEKQYARPFLARNLLSALQHNNQQRNTTIKNATKTKYTSIQQFPPTTPRGNATLLWMLLELPHPAHATTRTANHTWFSLCPPTQQSATQFTTEADM